MKRAVIFFMLLVFLLAVMITSLKGQRTGRNPGHLEYINYSMANGFPGIITKESIQDEKGFIWIATWNGLVRFDGYDFKLYEPDTSDLGNNIVQSLYLCSSGVILCPGQDVLRSFNPVSETFSNIEYTTDQEPKKPRILDLIEDDSGDIWVVTERAGVRVINRKENGEDSIHALRSLAYQSKKDSVLSTLHRLSRENLLQIKEVGNLADLSKTFQIQAERDFYISYFGEYSPEGNGLDIGWLENEKGDTIWYPDLVKTTPGGASYFVRFTVDQICLPPGKYTLRFQSSDLLSFEDLAKTNYPYSGAWGIKLIPAGKGKTEQRQEHLERFVRLKNSGKWLSHDVAVSLHKDRKGNIYIATIHGLDLFSQQESGESAKKIIPPTARHFQFAGKTKNQISALQVLKVFEAENNKIWISGYNPNYRGGQFFLLELFDPSTGYFTEIPNSIPLQRKVSNSGWDYYLNDVVSDGQGGIWISGAHSGLYHLDHSELNTTEPLTPKPDQFYYQFDRSAIGPLIHDLMVDQSNNLWVSTNEKGLYKLRARSRILNYVELPPQATGEVMRPAPLFTDSQSKIWVSTNEGKYLFCYDTKENTFIPVGAGEYKFLMGNMEDDKGNVWFGTNYGQIASYDKKLQKFSYFEIANSGVAYPHFQNGNGQIWVSDHQANISLFDPISATIEPIPIYSDSSEVGRWDGLTFMYPSNQNIWLGYAAGGIGKISIVNINGQDSFHFSEFLPKYRTVSFAIDFEGRKWVGTNFYGLLLFDEKQGIVKSITTKNGLLNNNVHGLFADNKERLWIHTLEGLQAMDLRTDSLMDIQFIKDLPGGAGRKATFLHEDGKFYISGNEGLYYFDLDSITADPLPPRVVLTDFYIDNQRINPGPKSKLSSSITYTDEVQLKFYENTIAIEYAGLQFDDSEEQIYAYRLLGQDDQWLEVEKERTARFNQLSPGNYTFQVKAANADGIWSVELATLQIVVRAPWYWNIWSKILYLLLFGGATALFYQLQLNRRLAEAETQRLSEWDLIKSRLYTNITHEFRTPLTLILGMVEEIIDHPQKWLGEGLQLIKRNGQRVLHLVNQLLDLAKLESNTLKAEYKQGNVIPFLAYITQSFQSYAATQDLHLHFLPGADQVLMDFDEDRLLQIVSNLIANAIKYTPAQGHIYVQTTKIDVNDRKHLCVLIKDTGEGINKSQLDRVFDRFMQIDDSSTRSTNGTGIGLALTKELVLLLKGQITVESEVGRGTTFKVFLPMTNKALSTKQTTETPINDGIASYLPTITTAVSMPSEQGKAVSKLPILLIIEDNMDVVRYLQACIPTSAYQIVFATNGQEGIDIAIEQIPDIIISDVMMPKKDGFEVLQALKHDIRTSHIPIVLLTAKADVESRIEGLQYGADAYLAKPFDKRELTTRIRELIRMRLHLQARYQTYPPIEITQNTMEGKEDAFIRNVRQIIEQNMENEDFGTLQLCKELNISRTQLHRKLTAVMGIPTATFIRTLRLKKAMALLRMGDLNVSEVGYSVGFSNSSHFTQAFTKYFGAPPVSFKGINQQDQTGKP